MSSVELTYSTASSPSSEDVPTRHTTAMGTQKPGGSPIKLLRPAKTRSHATNPSNAQRDLSNLPITLMECIGKGTFGEVFSTRIGTQTLAVKRVVLEPGFVDRELAMLQLLVQHPHPNTIALRGYGHQQCRGALVRFLVTDLFPMSLADVLEQWRCRGQRSHSKTKLYVYQLLRAVGHIHGLGIAHRDIKPHNALVNPTTGVLNLCDFGSAKHLRNKEETHTCYIASRYYRAPECLLENPHYSCAIDLWAVGCVVAELEALRPLLPGKDNSDQLYLAFRARGTPTREDFEELKPGLEAEILGRLLKRPRARQSWHQLLRTPTTKNFNGLLDGLLRWNPKRRAQALEALAFPYFNTIRSLSPSQQAAIGCQLFDFTEEEMLSATLTPTWSTCSLSDCPLVGDLS